MDEGLVLGTEVGVDHGFALGPELDTCVKSLLVIEEIIAEELVRTTDGNG